MRVVICDDDAMLRRVVADVVADCGGDVIAETDSALETRTLVTRFRPEVVVLDLALAVGSGWDLLVHLTGDPVPSRVVVFSAFTDDPAALVASGASAVVEKPDFKRLGEAVERVGSEFTVAFAERRNGHGRPVPEAVRRSPQGIDTAEDFYGLLANAWLGDELVAFRIDRPESGGVSWPDDDERLLVETVRLQVRVQDRVLRRGDMVFALVIGGNPFAASAVATRVAGAWSTAMPTMPLRYAAASMAEDEDGASLLARVSDRLGHAGNDRVDERARPRVDNAAGKHLVDGVPERESQFRVAEAH